MTTTWPSCASCGCGEQVTVTDSWSVQPGAGSPSETVSVSVAGPAAVHRKLGDAEAASLKVPEVAVQRYASGDGPASASCADDASAILAPTTTSPGFAEMPSATGQMLMVPLIETVPVVGA